MATVKLREPYATDDSAVRYFTPDSEMSRRKMRSRLEDRRAELGVFVLNGAASDFADYRFRIGQIDGLGAAIDICKELEKEEGN